MWRYNSGTTGRQNVFHDVLNFTWGEADLVFGLDDASLPLVRLDRPVSIHGSVGVKHQGLGFRSSKLGLTDRFQPKFDKFALNPEELTSSLNTLKRPNRVRPTLESS